MIFFFLFYCVGALSTLLLVDQLAEYRMDKVNALPLWHLALIVLLWPLILLTLLYGAIANYLARQ